MNTKFTFESYATDNFIFFPLFYLTTSVNASLAPYRLAGSGRLLTAILFYRELAVRTFSVSAYCSNVRFLLAIFKGGDSVRLTCTRHI